MVPRGANVGKGSRPGAGGGAEALTLLPALPPLPSQGPFSGPHGGAILAVEEAQTLKTKIMATASPPGDTGKQGLPSPLGAAAAQEANPVPLSRAAKGPDEMAWPGAVCCPPHLMSPGPQPPVDPTALLSTSTCQAQAGPHAARTVLTAGQPGGSPAIPWPHRAASVMMTRSGLCSLLS